MPSTSKNQQIAAAIALKAKKEGKKPEAGTASAQMAKMSKKDLEKFAGTKHKGLPKKKKKVNEAWGQKMELYVDIIYRWLEKKGLSQSEIDDVLNDPKSIEIIQSAESHGINPIIAAKEINIWEILTESLQGKEDPIYRIFFDEYLPEKGFFDSRFSDDIDIDPRRDSNAEEKILNDFSKYLEQEHYDIWDPALDTTLYKDIVHEFMTANESINEEVNFERGKDPMRAMDLGIFYEKWRKDHDGKILFTYTFYLMDPMGNKKTYWVHLYYSSKNESQRADTVYFDGERLIGGWGFSGTSHSLGNMQNKPSNMFTKEEATFWDNPEYFNKNTIDQLTDPKKAKKWFAQTTEEWFESTFEELMRGWFNSGVCRVDHSELKFKG